MQVCIAEKPSVAGEIAKVIGANARHEGYYEGNGYQVTWTFGHLCELKEPDEYQPIWKQWNLRTLPMLPDHFGIKLRNDGGVKRQFDIIKRLFLSAESIINCGDAGQEGELIQRWVLQLTGARCPVMRLWISSLTTEAIREGFRNLKPSSEFDTLYAAGAARAIGDWLLGMNATRAYTLRFAPKRTVLSIGRVQTPTLALIVQRFKEIQNFKAEDYWVLRTKYREVVFTCTRPERFAAACEAQAALANVAKEPLTISSVSTKQQKEAPPGLFDLTSLQVEANQKFGLSAEETLRIAQSLYEQKFTTYPRVDTRFLPDDVFDKVPDILKGLTAYANFVEPLLLPGALSKSKRVFNNLKVTDHHAIIPTGQMPHSALPDIEKKVFDMIARRFIANFYPEALLSLTTVEALASGVPFKVNGRQLLEPGWRALYPNLKLVADEGAKSGGGAKPAETVTVAELPIFKEGESGPHVPEVVAKQTQPPKLYTEATLLRAMETAGKQVDDPEVRQLMRENGIGRPSTRAAIIETILRRKFIVKKGKSLIPTEQGVRLTEIIATPLLKSVELTGLWERKLRQIESGEFTTPQFIAEMRQMVTEVVSEVVNDHTTLRLDTATTSAPTLPTKPAKQHTPPNTTSTAFNADGSLRCPKCMKPLLQGKAAWGCSGYAGGCDFRVPYVVKGKRLTEKQLWQLVIKGVTTVIKGLQVEGKSINGKLTFGAGFEVEVLPVETKSVDITQLSCPICGGAVVKGKTAWGCANFKQCAFRVPFVFMGKSLTATHLSVLTKKRRTATLSGFIDAAGNPLKGALVVANDGTLIIESVS